jgi:hypothetical protein
MKTQDPPDAAPVDVSRLLRQAQLAWAASDEDLFERSVRRIRDGLSTAPDHLLRSAVVLAQNSGRAALLADVIDIIGDRQTISVSLAMAVLRYAHALGIDELTGQVQSRLCMRVAPGHRFRFRVEAARLTGGVEAKLREARHSEQPFRQPVAAQVLGEALIDSGNARLAQRYLRRCARRWPASVDFARLYFTACLKCGDHGAARKALTHGALSKAKKILGDLTLALEIESENIQVAHELLKCRVETERKQTDLDRYFRTSISLGLIDEAEAAKVGLVRRLTRRQSAHFSITFVGSQLNEQKVVSQFEKGSSFADQRTLVASFYFPAKRVLDAHAGSFVRNREGVFEIPRIIHQYWDAATLPQDVDLVMQSWRDLNGWEYRRYDRAGAIDWLEKTLGKDFARAFRMANKIAEEADFLRLCVLFHEGGLYADADDKAVAHPETVLPVAARAVFVREPYGALANNTIAACPQHPTLQRAVELSLASLLARENDNTWLKTGPGLLTRAVALLYLDDPSRATAEVAILPQHETYRFVQPHLALPHKSTPAHWTGRLDKVDTLVETSLVKFASAFDPPA